jgi:hypothetical protein
VNDPKKGLDKLDGETNVFTVIFWANRDLNRKGGQHAPELQLSSVRPTR